MLKNSKLDLEEQVERAMQGEGKDGLIADNMNLYHGFLSGSRPQTQEYPRVLVYGHSPNFQEFQSGMAKVTGKRPSEEVMPRQKGKNNVYARDNDVETEYIPLEVLPDEAMPLDPVYEGGERIELLLEHDDLDMQEGKTVTFRVNPYNPGDITGSDWRDNIQNYESGNVDFRGAGS